MESNWENFLKNLGEWQGSFTQVSLEGEMLDSTPSILSLEGVAMYHHILVAGFSIPYLELSALYAACFLFFVINGAGSFSVDAWLAQGLKSQLSSEQAKQLTALEKSYTQEGDSDATEVGTGIQ